MQFQVRDFTLNSTMLMSFFKLIIVQDKKGYSEFILNLICIQSELHMHRSFLHSAQSEILLKMLFTF